MYKHENRYKLFYMRDFVYFTKSINMYVERERKIDIKYIYIDV